MSNELCDLGLNDRVRALFAPLAEEGFTLGRAVRVDRGLPLIQLSGEIVRAEAAPHLMRSADDVGSRVAVGDWVALVRPESHETWIIEAILPRSSTFIRKDPGERTGEQVVAANIDNVFVMQTAIAEPNLRRLERELVLAWESGACPVVLVSKCDLYDGDVDALVAELSSAAPGVDVIATSSATGRGMDEVRARLGAGVTATLLGSSGVGKSTLVNALVGTDLQATAAVRERDGKGRHTTVARELVTVPGGGVIVDTPGMRALALWNVECGIAAAFSDVVGLAQQCRFRDCSHTDEPGCAVLGAIDDGDLPARRLASYVDLRTELDELEERRRKLEWRRVDRDVRRT